MGVLLTQCVWKSEDNSMISGLSFVLTWVLGIELRLPNQISKYPTSADPSGQPNPLVFHFLFIIMSLLLKSQVWWYTPLILAVARHRQVDPSWSTKWVQPGIHSVILSLVKKKKSCLGECQGNPYYLFVSLTKMLQIEQWHWWAYWPTAFLAQSALPYGMSTQVP